MAEQLKYIVGALNKAPFNRSYNLISFDALEGEALLQVLSDVLCIIETKPSVALRNESAEDTAIRLFTDLRIMRYKLPIDVDDLSAFRAAVIEGDKPTIHSILQWALENINQLTQRAYLAKFLVPIDIPPEFQGDSDIEASQQECFELMEQFKLVHRESVTAKQEAADIDDIRQDLKSMEQEREQLSRRIEKSARKVDAIRNKDELVSLASQLRAANEREQQLSVQKHEQRNALMHVDAKISRIQQQLRDVRSNKQSVKPEDMITKLEEENAVHRYLLTDKLPKELEVKRKAVQHLSKVVTQPAMDNKHVENLKQQINDINDELVRLGDEHSSALASGDEKLSIYRHQAQMVQRKKNAVAERLQESRRELEQVEQEVHEKKQLMRDADGNEVVTSVQFKNYVTKLRSKTNTYKKKRSELQDLRAEFGVLARTEEILKTRAEDVKLEMEESGLEFVTIPAAPSQMSRPKTAKPTSDDVQQLKAMLVELEDTVEHEQAEFAPLIEQLEPLRAEYQREHEMYESAKRQYNQTAASLESGYAQLEQAVKSLRADVNSAQSEHARLEAEKRVLNALLSRAQNSDAFRVKLEGLLSESERLGVELRAQQSGNMNDQQDALKKVQMWHQLYRILQCKQKVLSRNM